MQKKKEENYGGDACRMGGGGKTDGHSSKYSELCLNFRTKFLLGLSVVRGNIV